MYIGTKTASRMRQIREIFPNKTQDQKLHQTITQEMKTEM